VPQLIGIKVAGTNRGMLKSTNAPRISMFVTGISWHRAAEQAHALIQTWRATSTRCKLWNELMKTDLEVALEMEADPGFLDTHILPYRTGRLPNQALDKLLTAIGGWSNVGTRLRWPYKWQTIRGRRCSPGKTTDSRLCCLKA
jgi:hypothetical protein